MIYRLIILLFLGSLISLPAPLQEILHGHDLAHAEEAEKVQYTCGMHPFIIQDEPGTCPICGMDLTPVKPKKAKAASASTERVVKYWVAPMDPSYISKEPGKSPMGMDLVPVYDDEAASGSVISIDPVTVQNMGVRTAPVYRSDLKRTIRTVGLVGTEEPKQYSVNSKIGGWIEKMYVSQTGREVRKGEPLLELYSPELVTAQEEYLLALENLDSVANSPVSEIVEGAKRLADAASRRLALWDISERQIKRIEKDRNVEKRLTLYAPFSGVVMTKQANVGSFVKPGSDILQIADLGRVWVYADIYEYELPWIEEGQRVTVEIPYGRQQRIIGTIAQLYPYVEAKTRTVKARIELENVDRALRPDMYVNVLVDTESVRNVMTIPVEAVLRSGKQQTVFVSLGDGAFEPRVIKTGLQDESGQVEVLQGLLDGEDVVVSAQFMLDSESKLREAIQKMLKPAALPASAEEAEDDDLFSDDPSATGQKQEKLDDLFN